MVTALREDIAKMQNQLCIYPFSGDDIEYLINLGISQLKHEVRHSEVMSKVAVNFEGTEYEIKYPWAAYHETTKLALTLAMEYLPKPKPTPGHVDVEAVKARNDILSVAERYTRMKKSGKNFTGKCPLHESKGFPLTVYPDSQSWYCYHCCKGGDVFDMVSTFENCDFKQAASVLGGT